MKKKEFDKKLSLNKETIANFQNNSIENLLQIKGGGFTDTLSRMIASCQCQKPIAPCPSVSECCPDTSDGM